ncbi:HAD-IIB family hydrolase [Thiomicrorhabdus sp.]|uniref:HAD-IIB family hydrolase n=1 Tax=Thiomicrorhabdus sp. TaxID=2039724 RepID=UPI0029C6500B|nr:HAD-IIB family hydrolase [Thiomicrorhabdus sp.]
MSNGEVMLLNYLFTDLDGTLLNHHDYEYRPVLPVLSRLKALGVIVILNSSKTSAELADWLKRLDLQTPYVAENGGAIYWPQSEPGVPVWRPELLGRPYSEIRSVLLRLREENAWDFAGFGDWSLQDVSHFTGLRAEDARRAKERAVSEPILWFGSDEQFEDFKAALSRFNLRVLKGGRFYHVMAHHDKANALRWIKERAIESANEPVKVLTGALGDGENDRAMLEAADFAMVLPAANGCLELGRKDAYYAQKAAPWGWVEAVEGHYLQQLALENN